MKIIVPKIKPLTALGLKGDKSYPLDWWRRKFHQPSMIILREDDHSLDMDEDEIRFEDVDRRDYE